MNMHEWKFQLEWIEDEKDFVVNAFEITRAEKQSLSSYFSVANKSVFGYNLDRHKQRRYSDHHVQ